MILIRSASTIQSSDRTLLTLYFRQSMKIHPSRLMEWMHFTASQQHSREVTVLI